jgi:hypothetical protein
MLFHTWTLSQLIIPCYIYLSMAVQPFVAPWLLFSFWILYTFGRTPWTGDQPVVRPPLTHTTTEIQNKRTYKTHMPWVWFELTSRWTRFMLQTARSLWWACYEYTCLKYTLRTNEILLRILRLSHKIRKVYRQDLRQVQQFLQQF